MSYEDGSRSNINAFHEYKKLLHNGNKTEEVKMSSLLDSALTDTQRQSVEIHDQYMKQMQNMKCNPNCLGENKHPNSTIYGPAREKLLQEAVEIVHKDRAADYGKPENNFKRIAELWTVYFDSRFTPHDVAIMMMLVKVARLANNPDHRDSAVDIAGYAACLAECQIPSRLKCAKQTAITAVDIQLDSLKNSQEAGREFD